VAGLVDRPGETLRFRHPRGVAPALVEVDAHTGAIRSVGVVRTARRLMAGLVYPRDRSTLDTD
jgi:2-methylaconitate cis-trans-isomerase PrpF